MEKYPQTRPLLLMLSLVLACLGWVPPAMARDTPEVRAKRIAALHQLFIAVDDALVLHDKGKAAVKLEAATESFLQAITGTSERLSPALLADIKTSAQLLRQPRQSGAALPLLRRIRHMLVQDLRVTAAPPQTPNFAVGQALFLKNCATCHGESGKADGVLSRKLLPPPLSFADAAAMAETSPFRSFLLINGGRPGTAMPAFQGKLTLSDMWNLAFYVATLRTPAPATLPPDWDRLPLALRKHLAGWGLSLTKLSTFSDAELRDVLAPALEGGSGLSMDALIAALRHAAPYVKSVPRE